MRVADSDPANVECRLRVGGVRLDVIDQVSAQAWTEFDTTESHQAQVFGNGGAHQSAQQPQAVSLPGGAADWIPAQHQLFATNGSPTRGGSYATVTVSGRGNPPGSERRLARAVAVSTLAAAPRGPTPNAP